MRFNRLVLASGVLLLAGIQSAVAEPEFAVTQEGNEFLFDYVAEKNSEITALGFRIELGDIDPDSVDLSRCTDGIPATHIGFCKANPGFIKVLVYSNENAVLETTHVGSIAVNGRVERSSNAGARSGQLREGRRELGREAILQGADSQDADGILGQIRVQNLSYSDKNANDIKGEVLQ